MSHPKRIMYQVLSFQSGRVISQLSLYGDPDEQTNQALMTMLVEAWAIAEVQEGQQRVILSRHMVMV